MCQFFSCVSDGKGNVKFFKPEDIVKIMAEGNPNKYDFNSHTSLMSWLGIKAKGEENWSKWEYNPESKELKLDEGTLADDKNKIQKILDAYFEGKDILFFRNLYSANSGNWNSGHGNSGHWNSGNGNSGDRNSGNGNSGDRNSGDGNSGHWNSGDRNSGNWNSGNGNSGHGNLGDGNSGDGNLNSFCTSQHWMLFDKACTKEEYEKIYKLDWSWFWINKWVNNSEMTVNEKKAYPTYKTCGGYLKKIEYKEAFKAAPPSFLDAVQKLANFDANKFKEISGISIHAEKKP